MPTYEYKCQKCGYLFELFQSMMAGTKTKCPKCNASAKRQISSGAGIIFKGSGFYATDYKKKSGRDDKKDKPSCPLNKDCKECHGPDKTV